jgi:Malectin domain
MRTAVARRRSLAISGLALAAALVLAATLSPPQAQAAYTQRVRVGSAVAFTDSGGNVWSADRAYVAGSYGYTSGDPYSTTAPIANTPDGALFQTNRHGMGFGYRFDVPNGAYQVRLRFAEIYPAAFGTGRRTFNVSIENNVVLQNFDVFALAGANAALDRVFTTNVADGVLTIDFVGVVSHAEVNAIEVLAMGGLPNATATPTLTPSVTLTPAVTPTQTATPISTPTPTATATPPPGGAGTQTITFDDLSNPNRVLSGQYPTGLIDWGTNAWYLSGPWGAFRTNSFSFNGPSHTSGQLTFLSPRRLVQLDAYNGGTVSSTVTVSCAGQSAKQVSVAVRQLLTISTSWTSACSPVTISSSNGWDTNFDSLVVDSGLPDFVFGASPASLTMGLTSSVQFNATVEMTGGFSPSSINLWVTGLPAGITGQYSPNPLPHEGTSVLTLTGDGMAYAGTYPVVLGATADNVSHSQTITLVVSSQPDFSLSTTPLSQVAQAGGASITYDVQITPMNGFGAPVTLSVSGLPAGVTATFNPQPVTPGRTSQMSVSAASTAASGTYMLQVVGTSGALTRSIPFTLVVGAGAVWSVDSIGSTNAQNNSMLVGPGRNDGINRLYVGTVNTGRVIEFTWTGSAWSSGVDIGGSPSGAEIHNMGMGPGRNDGVVRVYACSLDGELYELTYAGATWTQTTVGPSIGYCTHAAVGPGRNDGINRLYATRDRYALEYTWTGSNWSAVTVGSVASGLAHGIWIGPGRNNGTNFLYVATTNSGTYEGSFAGGSWALDSMGDRGDVRNVSVGAGRNDGVQRVYSATASGELREFSWTGTSWAMALAGAPLPFTLIHANVAAGRGDGVMRVYTSGADGSVSEYSYQGGSWTSTTLGGGTGYLYGFHLGVGRNDGHARLYGASFDHLVYEYSFGS